MYEYRAEVVRIIDGDTIVVNIDLGLKQWSHDVHLRIRNIDAPEARTRDLAEKEKGLAAKAFLEEKLPIGEQVIVKTYKSSFNRYVADVRINLTGVDVASMMVEAGHAAWSVQS